MNRMFLICSQLKHDGLKEKLDSLGLIKRYQLHQLESVPQELQSSQAVFSVATATFDESLSNHGEVADELSADVFDLSEMTSKAHIGAIFFDMDSTLIDMEVIVALADYAGVAKEVSEITESAMRGELDFSQSLKKRVNTLKGLKSEIVDEIKSKLPLNPGIKLLAQFLKKNSIYSCILSGGFTPFSDYLKQMLEFNESKANHLATDNEMRLTGEVVGEIVDANLKKEIVVKRMQELEKTHGSQWSHMVVGDGANDLPMMSTTAYSVGFRAKAKVKEKARFCIERTGHDALIYLIKAIQKDL